MQCMYIGSRLSWILFQSNMIALFFILLLSQRSTRTVPSFFGMILGILVKVHVPVRVSDIRGVLRTFPCPGPAATVVNKLA